MKTNQGEKGCCLLVVGEWQAAREVCLKEAEAFLKGPVTDDSFVVVRGDEYTEGQVIELLKTRGLFSSKKVVVYQDPDFLFQGKGDEASLAKGIKQALKGGKAKRAARLLGRFLASKGLGVSALEEPGHEKVMSALNEIGPEDRDALGLILQEEFHEVKKALSGGAGKGQAIISWIEGQKGKKKAPTLLIIHLTDICQGNRALTHLMKRCRVIDLRLRDKGRGKGGENASRAFVTSFLKERGLTIEPSALAEFLRLVGSESVSALKNELDKLVTLCGNRKKITLQDVTTLVTRHREEELYKLADTFRQKDLAGTLVMMEQILCQNVHPLAILALIRNTLVRMLAIKALAKDLSNQGLGPMSFNEFKARLWPEMKKEFSQRDLSALARLHPYAAYLHLQAPYNLKSVVKMLEELPGLDLELKGSKLEPRLVLEGFLFRHLN
ncbi:MAG: hypothetical protein GXO58_04120 [Thermodesulfobacteria bacterium]|nr:hypothetical protein [Thermodesulfobacteriota bacterium]